MGSAPRALGRAASATWVAYTDTPPKIGQSFRTSRTLFVLCDQFLEPRLHHPAIGAAVVEELDDGHRTPWIPENWRVRVVEQIVRANGGAVGCRSICELVGTADGSRADGSHRAQEQDTGEDAVRLRGPFGKVW